MSSIISKTDNLFPRVFPFSLALIDDFTGKLNPSYILTFVVFKMLYYLQVLNFITELFCNTFLIKSRICQQTLLIYTYGTSLRDRRLSSKALYHHWMLLIRLALC